MKDSQRHVKQIPAARSVEVSCFGDKLFVESASFPFNLRPGNGNTSAAKNGFELDMQGENFSTLLIQNPNTTTALDAVIWVGSARVKFHFPAIPATALCASKYTIAGGNPLTLPGVATSATLYSQVGVAVGQRRKQFVVSNNRSNTNSMTIKDALGNEFAAVEPGTDYTLETDAGIIISGTNGDIIRAAEIFYL